MVQLVVNKKNKGFSLIEGTVALVLFGVTILLAYKNAEEIQIFKKAKIYSDQSQAYAVMAAKYLQESNEAFSRNYSTGQANFATVSNYYSYKVDFAANKYPSNVVTFPLPNFNGKPLFNQTPCVALYYDNSNNDAEMQAYLYYTYNIVKGKPITHKDSEKITLKAINYNPSITEGYFSSNSKIVQIQKVRDKNNVISYTGWYPNSKLINYLKSNICGNGVLDDNSLIINLNLMPEYNPRLLAMSGLQKSTDQTAPFVAPTGVINSGSGVIPISNPLFLPGHIFNNNTLKSKLVVNESVILQKSSGIAINVAYGSGASQNTTLNIGKSSNKNDNDTGLIVSGIQPNINIKSGSSCLPEELGKVTAGAQEKIGKNSEISRNIVTCTHNTTLCSGSGYCYLPAKAAKYQFCATPTCATGDAGLEDDSTGIFKCPSYAPYLVDFHTSTTQQDTDVFVNQGGYTTQSKINTVRTIDSSNNGNVKMMYGGNGDFLSRYYNCGGGCQNGVWDFLTSIDFSENNIIHGTRISSGGTSSVEKIYNNTDGLVTPIGVKSSGNFSNCNVVCSRLNSILGNSWVDIRTIQGIGKEITYSGITPDRCACGYVGGEIKNQIVTRIYGMALIKNISTHVNDATCSNYPLYQF